jgi:UDP-3-O-[3-hydroxymyristoyl] glucosamine N-acyltransferase
MTTGGLSLAELAAAVEARSKGRLIAQLDGHPDRRLSGVASLAAAAENHLSFLANPRFRSDAIVSGAGAIVMTAADRDALRASPSSGPTLIVVDKPYAWYAFAAQVLCPAPQEQSGIATSAEIGADTRIDPTSRIDAHATVGNGASVGRGAWIGAGAVLGAGAILGEHARLHPRAVVLDGCSVGARSIVHSGAVIGADGFGFAPLDGEWIKIPQTGGVSIGEDVEIGANTTIDRGSLDDTIIEDGVKLDNQIQIAHNCVVGAHTAIAGCVGIAGSTRIGRYCQIGGAAMISGHLSIADHCVIGGGTLVSGSIDTPGHYTGSFPMMKDGEWQRVAAIIRHLDDLRDRLRRLEAGHRKETT